MSCSLQADSLSRLMGAVSGGGGLPGAHSAGRVALMLCEKLQLSHVVSQRIGLGGNNKISVGARGRLANEDFAGGCSLPAAAKGAKPTETEESLIVGWTPSLPLLILFYILSPTTLFPKIACFHPEAFTKLYLQNLCSKPFLLIQVLPGWSFAVTCPMEQDTVWSSSSSLSPAGAAQHHGRAPPPWAALFVRRLYQNSTAVIRQEPVPIQNNFHLPFVSGSVWCQKEAGACGGAGWVPARGSGQHRLAVFSLYF